MANYQLGNRWTPDIYTDQATLDAAAKGGSGAGGSTTVLLGGGKTGDDAWRYATLGASAQRHITINNLTLVVNSAVGFWMRINNFAALKKVFIFLANDAGFIDYFRVVITANELEQGNGWVFINRAKSEFATTGAPSWANPIVTIRLGVTADSTAVGGETLDICNFHTYLFTKPKVLLFHDDSNITDLTQSAAYLNTNGMVASSSVYKDNIGRSSSYLSEADLVTLSGYGWSIICHEKQEFTITGTASATGAVLSMTGGDWVDTELVNSTVTNTTTGASATITANTASTITGVLSSGEWTTGDGFFVSVLQARQETNMARIKNYVAGLGYSGSSIFALPGGKFNEFTIPAAQAVGITVMRTTIQTALSPAIELNKFALHARSTAVNVLTDPDDAVNIAALLSNLDDAIANKSTFATFTHRLDATPTAGSIHTKLAVWQGFIDGVKTRVDSGLCDVVNVDDYLAGLTESIWSEPSGSFEE